MLETCNSTHYSTCFHTIRNAFYTGRFDYIRTRLDAIDAEMISRHQYNDSLAEDMGLLNLLETSTLYLYIGSVKKSLKYNRYAECLIEKRENQPILWELLRKSGSIFGTLAGGQNDSVYNPVGYERVLLLNIQAMDYLLEGDDRAFNVARKSTEWQELEREKFAKKIETFENRQKNWEDEGKTVGKHEDLHTKNQLKNKLYARLAKELAKYNRKALQVPSAFVNPFGDYLAGVVKEYKSVDVDFRSQMDNARIHYEKAYKLNPKSRILKLAYKDAKKRRSAKRLVQIVAFDGFAPEKNILRLDIKLKECPLPIHIELPVYDPVKSKVHRIVVSTLKGKTLATFRPIADVEALALRHQKDLLPLTLTSVALAAIRDYSIKIKKNKVSEAIEKKFGPTSLITKSLEDCIGLVAWSLDRKLEPDTSSWISLPKQIFAARFHPSKHLKTIVVTSYDIKGRRLARRKITLGQGGRHFIFVRTTDKTMKVIVGKPIWSPKEKIKRIDC